MRIIPFTTLPGGKGGPKFSPDGKFVAFVWVGPNRDNADIYVKQVGRGEEPFRLTTDPARDLWPVWSPDGGEIAFVRVSGEVASIYTVAFPGGAERKLYGSRSALMELGLSWSPEGHWLAFSERSAVQSPARIYLLSLDTRQKIPLTSPPPAPYGDSWPEFSPDGKRMAFVRRMSYNSHDLWVQPVPSGEATRLTYGNYPCGGGQLAWTTDGREVVFDAAWSCGLVGLFRVPLNGGVPRALAGIGGIAGSPAVWRNYMVFRQQADNQQTLWRMRGPNYKGNDRSAAPLLPTTRQDWGPDYSPDGKKLAFYSSRSGFIEIWVCDSDGLRPVQLTNLRKTSATPRWSPDGRRIVFASMPADQNELYVIDADGGIPRLLTNDHSQGELPRWSRDGRWIYFASNRSGTFQVWRMRSEGGKAVQITKGGGRSAVESFDGRMLYYQKPGRHSHDVGTIWKVPCEGGMEEPVLDREIWFCSWALRPEGIYFATQTGKKYLIEFLSYRTGKIIPFYQEDTSSLRNFLTISPDGEWFVYTEFIPGESDLMLVENFR